MGKMCLDGSVIRRRQRSRAVESVFALQTHWAIKIHAARRGSESDRKIHGDNFLKKNEKFAKNACECHLFNYYQKRGTLFLPLWQNQGDLIDRFQLKGLIRKSLIKEREGRQL